MFIVWYLGWCFCVAFDFRLALYFIVDVLLAALLLVSYLLLLAGLSCCLVFGLVLGFGLDELVCCVVAGHCCYCLDVWGLQFWLNICLGFDILRGWIVTLFVIDLIFILVCYF